MSSPSRPPQYPPPAAPPSAEKSARRASRSGGTNVKETLESILVAFILAFIFRAFVVEAFVIPTGSMATTLLGAHMHFRCPDCGYEFDVNYSSDSRDADDMSFPQDAALHEDIYCPNCGYLVRPHNTWVPVKVTDSAGNQNTVRVPKPDEPLQPVNFGDRILVLKYAYLFNEPHRWDVIVFKSPDKPDDTHYTQNFIKRLVGLPGETLMVLDGDLYRKNGPGTDDWEILRRPPNAQQAVWRNVYDNDFYPQGLPRNNQIQPWTQPWQPTSADGEWNLGSNAATGRIFHFNGTTPSTIRFNSQANPNTQSTTDYLVYDTSAEAWQNASPVSDLKLSMWYQRSTGTGPLELSLTKRGIRFTASIASDSVELDETQTNGQPVRLAGPLKLADLHLPSSPLAIDFINDDYRVSLNLNGQEVLHTTPDQYSPDVRQLRAEYEGITPRRSQVPHIEITAGGQQCDLSHINLSRDIYYTNTGNTNLVWAMPNNPIVLHHKGDPRVDGPGVYDDDEFFVLGDNSQISEDARYWNQPIKLDNEDLDMQAGRVPGRFILGRAFFVYWPAGFRPYSHWPPLIPDAGDMRFIH